MIDLEGTKKAPNNPRTAGKCRSGEVTVSTKRTGYIRVPKADKELWNEENCEVRYDDENIYIVLGEKGREIREYESSKIIRGKSVLLEFMEEGETLRKQAEMEETEDGAQVYVVHMS